MLMFFVKFMVTAVPSLPSPWPQGMVLPTLQMKKILLERRSTCPFAHDYVKLLIEKGAEPNVGIIDGGATPLHLGSPNSSIDYFTCYSHVAWPLKPWKRMETHRSFSHLSKPAQSWTARAMTTQETCFNIFHLLSLFTLL